MDKIRLNIAYKNSLLQTRNIILGFKGFFKDIEKDFQF